MAKVNFAQDDERPPLDTLLEDFAERAKAAGKGVRFRCQPDLYDQAQTRYQAWPGLIWTVELEDAAEGKRLREGLAQFFRLFGHSAETQDELLATLATVEPTVG